MRAFVQLDRGAQVLNVVRMLIPTGLLSVFNKRAPVYRLVIFNLHELPSIGPEDIASEHLFRDL